MGRECGQSLSRLGARVAGGGFGGVVDHHVFEGFAGDGVITAEDRADRGDVDEMAQTADRPACASMLFGIAGKRSIAVLVEAQSRFERCDERLPLVDKREGISAHAHGAPADLRPRTPVNGPDRSTLMPA